MRESAIYREILEEGRQEGLQKGRQEGLQEGRQEGIELVARNLLSIGMSPEQIAAATGLAIEHILKLTTNS